MSCLIADLTHDLLPVALLKVRMKTAAPKMIVVIIVCLFLSILNSFIQI